MKYFALNKEKIFINKNVKISYVLNNSKKVQRFWNL